MTDTPTPLNTLPPPETRLSTACMLSMTGGFLDAFTYIGHGHVFANVMSANVVLLGVFATTDNWVQGLKHIPPIAAFMAGVFAAQVIRLPEIGIRRPALMALLLEIAVLAVISVLPRGSSDVWIVLSIAFAAALQHASFTKVSRWSYNSVMTTVNLRLFTEELFAVLKHGHKPAGDSVVRIYGPICLSFLSGAVIGGVATRGLENAALWLPVALLLIVGWRTAYPQRAAVGGDIQAPS